MRAVRPGRRSGILQPLAAQRHGPGRKEAGPPRRPPAGSGAARRTRLALPARSDRGSSTGPRPRAALGWHSAEARAPTRRSKLASSAGRGAEPRGSGRGPLWGENRAGRRRELARGPAGAAPTPLLLTLTPAPDVLLQEPQPPCEERPSSQSAQSPAFSWPTSSPAPGEWGARKRSPFTGFI